ncbi:hypothetical protein BLNAU_10006 [Blattamonas nauphoetae]|uniref:Uncharacterized protein n=1 Tax=Blattamonas nauphoetae TaxID=2049346 RepID=A0ABQ9XUB4_9EUKA|nr:hypothetical protein BLNAU_10006 [Blattamonas nauphoetae]
MTAQPRRTQSEASTPRKTTSLDESLATLVPLPQQVQRNWNSKRIAIQNDTTHSRLFKPTPTQVDLCLADSNTPHGNSSSLLNFIPFP